MDSGYSASIMKPSGTDMSYWIDTAIQSLAQFEVEQDRRPLTEKADPLALSWAAYHVWQKFPNRRWVAWNDIEAQDHDREMAQETRRYYRNKLAMRALKSTGESSQFSRDLYDICNGGIIRECHRGMLYRLPYFYVEDTKREALIEHTRYQPTINDSMSVMHRERHVKEISRYDRIFHSRRGREIMEYWFHDETTGHPVQWSVTYENPLRSVVEHVVNANHKIKIYGHWLLGHDARNDFYFWKVTQPELRFE